MQVTTQPDLPDASDGFKKQKSLSTKYLTIKIQCNSCGHLPLWLGPTFRHLYLCLDGRVVMVICEVTCLLPPIVLHRAV